MNQQNETKQNKEVKIIVKKEEKRGREEERKKGR